jgi:hypothetical protein
MGNNQTVLSEQSNEKSPICLHIQDEDFTIKYIRRDSERLNEGSEFSGGSLKLQVQKSLELLFLDPFSPDGEERIELEMSVYIKGIAMFSNADKQLNSLNEFQQATS